jgi:hypothetical protein
VTAVATVWHETMMRRKRANGSSRHHDFIVAFLESMIREVNLRRGTEFASASFNIVRARVVRQRHGRRVESGKRRHGGARFRDGLTRAGGKKVVSPPRVNILEFFGERAGFLGSPA